MNTDKVRGEAKRQIADEDFDTAVAEEKRRLRTYVPLWHMIFPWKITIVRRDR